MSMLVLAFRIAMIILHFTVNSFIIRQQKLFFYLLFFLEKPDFLKIILPFTMSVMCIISYSVFNEHWFFSLSQLSLRFLHRLYSYTSSRLYPCKTYQMGSSGLEPPTSRLSGARSNLLSYEPAAAVPQPYSHIFQLDRRVITRSTAFGLP